jgi:hypothetical protein
MLYTIPIKNMLRTNIEFIVTLTNVKYKIKLSYNYRTLGWFISLYDMNSIPIITGYKIKNNIPLFHGIALTKKPAGELMFIDLTRKEPYPTFTGIGTKQVLTYED